MTVVVSSICESGKRVGNQWKTIQIAASYTRRAFSGRRSKGTSFVLLARDSQGDSGR